MAVEWSDQDYEILQKTIYGEARGEQKEGQIAVAHVILNRVRANRPYWGGNSITGVCLHPFQFECWNGNGVQIKEPRAFAAIGNWLGDVLAGKIEDPTCGSDHYNNPRKENATWVNNVDYIKDIGEHRFYRSRQ